MRYNPDEIISDLWLQVEPDKPSPEYLTYLVSFVTIYMLMNPNKAVSLMRLCLLELDGWEVFNNYPSIHPLSTKEDMISSLKRVNGDLVSIFEDFCKMAPNNSNLTR